MEIAELLIMSIIWLWSTFPFYIAGQMQGWESGRIVYRMWDSKRFTSILAKHLDIQTDDGCDVDFVRHAIKQATVEYKRGDK